MQEIDSIPWNGFTVASTFSGCGGSCLGYRMAGFRVKWANEFVPIAQESYRANSKEMLDGRDIHLVTAEDILAALGMKQGELDVLDGSPPCQAFSTAGKRHKGWGIEKQYEHGAAQCNEKLFDEYIRLLRGLMPRVFVAENVSGLIKGTSKGYFLQILAAMKATGYKVKCQLLDAQWLGVPQRRQRTIFIGVRHDLSMEPVHPSPLPYRYSVKDAIPGMERIQAGSFASEWRDADQPSATIAASGGSRNNRAQCQTGDEVRKFTLTELKRICGFPDDFTLVGSYVKQWERLGNAVPPVMMSHIAATIRDNILLPLTHA